MAFSIPIPISLDSELSVGTYDFTFRKLFDFSGIPNLILPVRIPVNEKEVDLGALSDSPDHKKLVMRVVIKTNPIPVVLIGAGIFALLGLGLGYLVLEKVERVVDNPAVEIGIVAGSILLVFGLLKYARQ